MSNAYRFYCNPCKGPSIFPFQVEDSLYCSMCGRMIRLMSRNDKEEFKDEVIRLEINF